MMLSARIGRAAAIITVVLSVRARRRQGISRPPLSLGAAQTGAVDWTYEMLRRAPTPCRLKLSAGIFLPQQLARDDRHLSSSRWSWVVLPGCAVSTDCGHVWPSPSRFRPLWGEFGHGAAAWRISTDFGLKLIGIRQSPAADIVQIWPQSRAILVLNRTEADVKVGANLTNLRQSWASSWQSQLQFQPSWG